MLRAGKVPARRSSHLAGEFDGYRSSGGSAAPGAAITDAANDIRFLILVGAVVNNPNSGTPVETRGHRGIPKAGPSQYHVKRHPVPTFGEFTGRSLLSRFISRFDRVPHMTSQGNEPGVFQVAFAKLSFCFQRLP